MSGQMPFSVGFREAVEANPLEDIRATRRIDRVILRGREVLDAADLRALLEGVARR